MDLLELHAQPGRRHPWESARVRALRDILRRLPSQDLEPLVEIGCGDAFVLSELAREQGVKNVVGVDALFTDQDLRHLASTYPRIEFLRSAEELGERRFATMLLLDVLEHIPDDRAFLRDLVERRLLPHAQVVITVPAFQSLFSEHDQQLRHERRYDPGQLRRTVDTAGLEVLRGGYLFGSLLPVRALGVALERMQGPKERPGVGVAGWRHGRIVSTPIELALRLDNRVSLAFERLGLPHAGLTEWMLCNRR